jgi:hypothetical protein
VQRRRLSPDDAEFVIGRLRHRSAVMARVAAAPGSSVLNLESEVFCYAISGLSYTDFVSMIIPLLVIIDVREAHLYFG